MDLLGDEGTGPSSGRAHRRAMPLSFLRSIDSAGLKCWVQSLVKQFWTDEGKRMIQV